MGYYTIRLDPAASEICTIIFPWGKYSYKRLPMGFGGSADIFQAQMMDLMASQEYVRAYIDDVLIITRGTLDDHIDKRHGIHLVGDHVVAVVARGSKVDIQIS